MKKVMDRYKDVVYAWDVVNEAVATGSIEDRNGLYRT